MTIQFNVTGPDRKKLVGAISTTLNDTAKYKGAPTFAYEIGDPSQAGKYHIDKTGTVTGPDNRELIDILAEHHGFAAIISEYDDNPSDEVPAFEDAPQPSDTPEPEASLRQIEEWAEGQPDIDTLSIDIPLEGFTSENIDNLCKLVGSKEVLIKKALGAEALPVQVLEDRISFPWFKAGMESEHILAYAAFITHLADTAKNKNRITAKAQESFENEKFAMRVWLIGLGLIGKEFNLTRKLLMANLGGNSSWRYGAPDKTDASEEQAPAPIDTTPADESATAPTETATGAATPDNLAEALADAALIHAVNESFEKNGETEAQGDE